MNSNGTADRPADVYGCVPCTPAASFEEAAKFFGHRCRNDLTTIRNLISLRAPFAKDPIALARSMEERIGALSLAYNHCSAKAGKELTLKSLVCDIVKITERPTPEGRTLISNLPQLEVNLRLASPMALWIYEILSNAITHGIDHKGQALVDIKGNYLDGNLVLSISDQGPGLPPGFDLERDSMAGLKVAHAVASHDLKAEMEILSQPKGLRVTLNAPLVEIERLNRM